MDSQLCDGFGENLGVHKRIVLSRLLHIHVFEAISKEVRADAFWEIL